MIKMSFEAATHQALFVMIQTAMVDMGQVTEQLPEDKPIIQVHTVDIVPLVPDETLNPPQETLNPPQAVGVPGSVDSNNHPWDERIHATTHTTNADGTWKIMRRPKRFDTNTLEWKVYIQDVLNELSGDEPPLATETENPEPVPVPPALVPAAPAAEGVPVSLAAFIQFMTNNSPTITTKDVIDICVNHGVPQLMSLYSDDNLTVVPMVYAEVQALIMTRNENH